MYKSNRGGGEGLKDGVESEEEVWGSGLTLISDGDYFDFLSGTLESPV